MEFRRFARKAPRMKVDRISDRAKPANQLGPNEFDTFRAMMSPAFAKFLSAVRRVETQPLFMDLIKMNARIVEHDGEVDFLRRQAPDRT